MFNTFICWLIDHDWGGNHHGFKNQPLDGATCLRCSYTWHKPREDEYTNPPYGGIL